MATASCITSAGVYSRSQPFRLASGSCMTVAGVSSATARVPWGGSSARRRSVDWIPSAQVAVVDSRGKMTQPWYRFFKEVSERRLGGIEATSIPDIVNTQTTVQDQVLVVQQGVQAVGDQVSAVTDTVNVQTQVAKQNNLPGSAQLSTLPSYKQEFLDKDF